MPPNKQCTLFSAIDDIDSCAIEILDRMYKYRQHPPPLPSPNKPDTSYGEFQGIVDRVRLILTRISDIKYHIESSDCRH